MGIHEQIVDQMVEQFNSLKDQITAEVIEAQPGFIATNMLIKTFKSRGFTEDEIQTILSTASIEIDILPDNLQELLDVFVDTMVHIQNVMTEAGHSPILLKTVTSQMSLHLKNE